MFAQTVQLHGRRLKTHTAATAAAAAVAAAICTAASTRLFSDSAKRAAGHAKWQNIMHTKAKNDLKRSKAFARIANQITVAVREGGDADPAHNVRLAAMVDVAFKNNLPKRVVEAAIARASRSGSAGDNTATMLYEGMGPGGVAVMIEVLTDNKNRAAQTVRAALGRHRGSLTACAYLFERRGWVVLDPKNGGGDVDGVLEWTLEQDADIEDVVKTPGGGVAIITAPQALQAVATAARERYTLQNIELRFDAKPETAVPAGGKELEQSLAALVDALEELEDVSAVYTNYAGV